jgi:isoaspartyl peptidase/L-asparaginase-like protein (Ntn-hydrolase superfamily)
MTRPIALALHGGAGADKTADYAADLDHMRGLVESGASALRAGAAALDVAVETVAALEASGRYNAGRGAVANSAGDYELDACLMDGPTARVGAVAALQGFKHPILVARAVMERSAQVLLAGDGAAAFARGAGLEALDDPAWFVDAKAERGHGTVGCVALDRDGGTAAATSTGGYRQKPPGRVGDSPIPGAGAWADEMVAVSSTGAGEYFLRTAAAAQLAFRMRWAGEDLAVAAEAVLAQITALGGFGGLIAVDTAGRITMPFTGDGMRRAAAYDDGRIVSAVF